MGKQFSLLQFGLWLTSCGWKLARCPKKLVGDGLELTLAFKVHLVSVVFLFCFGFFLVAIANSMSTNCRIFN